MAKLKLEKEMYDEAKAKGVSFTTFLHSLENGAGEVDPEFFLTRARSEALGTKVDEDLSRKLDAFELQLEEYGIKVSGKEVSLVEDFYKTNESSILFPEFINRNVRIGMEQGVNECRLEDLVAVTQDINAASYQPFYAEYAAAKKGAFRVGEFGQFPTTKITYAEKTITLYKFGHKFVASYEVIRRMRINTLAVHLQKIGTRLRRDMVYEAYQTLVNGDGNSNPAPVFDQPTLDYNDFVDFFMEFKNYEPRIWVGDKATVAAILKLSEFKDPQAGFNFQRTGQMISPIGITLRRFDDVAANSLVGVDNRSALEQINETGSQLIEAEKVIDKQYEDAVISQVSGFAKIYTEACRIWDYTND